MTDPFEAKTLLTLAIIVNAILLIPMALLIKRDFASIGRASWPLAIWSGAMMHGHALATFAVAWFDRGSIVDVTAFSLASGGAIGLTGALVIYLGRKAYGDRARVYGLREDELIEHGIYKRSRNPQYLGYWLMFIGAAIGLGSGLALLFAALFAVIIHTYVRWVEEPHLTRHFGDAYAAYCQRVSRY